MSAGAPVSEFWGPLRVTTRARIGLGRTGDALPTARLLDLRSAHAVARDAVHQPWDAGALERGLVDLGLTVHRVRSQAPDRATYLRRPDLGRAPEDLDLLRKGSHDVGIVLADGLSARAHDAHAVPLVAAVLTRLLSSGLSVAPVVLAEQARVGIGDSIGARLGVTTLIVLIGERPGLSVADSLGAYLTHEPRVGRRDSERNCVSNIHPPDGLGYEQAAGVILRLLHGARELGASGVGLKDVSERAQPVSAITPPGGAGFGTMAPPSGQRRVPPRSAG